MSILIGHLREPPWRSAAAASITTDGRDRVQQLRA
ncbi:hypothetical protein SAMN05216252_11117 [Actinacidiphila glaucinigra]|uniref:Uncharacterized protein n=1 Tax=Actinacidiphila glaucinigra TaxID=235986 RepID=A0A239ILK0_9ACTN|nr:hypothetical protein SAMN05216252_11117 [Actinacidiphila glaucinigra]